MTSSHDRHEFSNSDPLVQNNFLRQTINALPKRRVYVSDIMTETKKAELGAIENRSAKQYVDEYRMILRDQFAARLAGSYATPSLQRYALMCFEEAYVMGLTQDAVVPFDPKQPQPYHAQRALLTLVATDDLTSPGLYDLQIADRIETILYGLAQVHIVSRVALFEELIQNIREVNAELSLDENTSLDIPLAHIRQLQAITANWPTEYRMQYGEDITT